MAYDDTIAFARIWCSLTADIKNFPITLKTDVNIYLYHFRIDELGLLVVFRAITLSFFLMDSVKNKKIY